VAAAGTLTLTGCLYAGRKMAEFPVDPMLAKMLIQSEKFGVSGELLSCFVLRSGHRMLAVGLMAAGLRLWLTWRRARRG